MLAQIKVIVWQPTIGILYLNMFLAALTICASLSVPPQIYRTQHLIGGNRPYWSRRRDLQRSAVILAVMFGCFLFFFDFIPASFPEGVLWTPSLVLYGFAGAVLGFLCGYGWIRHAVAHQSVREYHQTSRRSLGAWTLALLLMFCGESAHIIEKEVFLGILLLLAKAFIGWCLSWFVLVVINPAALHYQLIWDRWSTRFLRSKAHSWLHKLWSFTTDMKKKRHTRHGQINWFYSREIPMLEVRGRDSA
jgi:hypothetical protein